MFIHIHTQQHIGHASTHAPVLSVCSPLYSCLYFNCCFYRSALRENLQTHLASHTRVEVVLHHINLIHVSIVLHLSFCTLFFW